MAGTAPAIGIDLGTSSSCVGVWMNDKMNIITNDHGNRTTPSYVAFTETERIIGDSAKDQVGMNPENTVFDAKRLIGRRFDDPKIQEDMKHWPFKVVNKCGKPKIRVEFKGDTKTYAPEEISSMVLVKMKEMAEAFIGATVKNAVITVPAYFNDSQRQATIDAGTIAGLNVLSIINEPTAAASAYWISDIDRGKKTVLIFNLGRKTFNVSIVNISEVSRFEVMTTAEDSLLGGEDFDNLLVNYLVDEFKRKFRKELRTNPKGLNRLRTAVERAKIDLSSSAEARIDIDALNEGINFNTKVSRSRFEDLCVELFSSTINLIQQTLNRAHLEKASIHEVILVGGSTKIPKIQSLLHTFFPGISLRKSINPEEVVACGAALQAAILIRDTSKGIKDIRLVDVSPPSLGVQTVGGVTIKIFDSNTTISRSKSTRDDNQNVVAIKVFQGERAMTNDNNHRHTFDLTGIPPAPRDVPSIEVTFNLDANTSGKSMNITIENNKDHLPKEKIDREVAKARMHMEEDDLRRERIAARMKLENFLSHGKSDPNKTAGKSSDSDKSNLRKECEQMIRWIDRTLADKEEYEHQLDKLTTACSQIMSNHDGSY